MNKNILAESIKNRNKEIIPNGVTLEEQPKEAENISTEPTPEEPKKRTYTTVRRKEKGRIISLKLSDREYADLIKQATSINSKSVSDYIRKTLFK